MVDVLGLGVLTILRLHLDHPGGRRSRGGDIDPDKLDGDILWNLG